MAAGLTASDVLMPKTAPRDILQLTHGLKWCLSTHSTFGGGKTIKGGEVKMITRMWFGKTKPENADAYVTHLRTAVFPELQGIGGFRGAQVLRRDRSNHVEFSVQTQWDSMDAIRQFAGSEPEIAVVPPEAQAFLSEYDATVKHFEVVTDVSYDASSSGGFEPPEDE